MAQYQKIDGQCSNNLPRTWSARYSKEEHLEVELYQRDSDLRHRHLTCMKNPGHEKFIPIQELCLDNFPLPLRHQCIMDYVSAFSHLVVRIKVKHTSSGRLKDDPFHKIAGRCVYRGATGCVDEMVDAKNIHEVPCRDDSCLLSGTPHDVYGFIHIKTNRHVIFDTKEAQNAEVDCVTHDADFIPRIHRLAEEAKILGAAIPRAVKDCSMTDYAIIVSHPHGSSKTFSVGGLVDYHKAPDKKGFLGRFHKLRVSTYTAPTCPGCTGAPVVTGYDDGWAWWRMGHSTADHVAELQLAFTYK
ncbi:hypothetical protein Btru_014865 [Bulinus truncatus]|nr:hypothetical protein Btru_014865 [Bulinus truncatus]